MIDIIATETWLTVLVFAYPFEMVVLALCGHFKASKAFATVAAHADAVFH